MIRAVTIILLTVVCTTLAMPPAPGVRESMIEQGTWDHFVTLRQEGLAKGIDTPFEFDRDLLRRDEPITLRAICILADFDDNEAQESVDHYQEMLFSEDEMDPGSMRDWYLENSYERVNIVGQVYGWYRMPEDYEYYVNDAWGFGEYPRNAARMVEEVLQLADDDIDYSEFDNDDNGYVEALFIVHAGGGAEANNRNTSMIWSHAAQVPRRVGSLDGMQFRSYAMEPEDGRIGVFGHELGHSMFGLPDLYDGTYNSAGIGMWSMMAGGSWGGGGRRPVHFDAWCKSRIGFLEPFPIVENQEGIELQPVEEIDDVLLAWRHGDWSSQYFLLENRQPIGFDASLPSGGLLIWHIDESRNNNNNPWWPGAGMAHNIVALEQADGDYDLEYRPDGPNQNGNSGDRGDPFPGSSDNFRFDANTSPDSKDYAGSETDVTVYNIAELNNDLIGFDIGVFPGIGMPELSVYIWNTIPDEHQYPDPDIRPEEVLTDELTLVTDILSEIYAPVDSIGEILPEDLLDYSVVIYLEPWREDEEAEGGITFEEQERLVEFLLAGNNLILIGPDIATNLQGEDNPLWPYLIAQYDGEGVSSDEGNITRLRSNTNGRLTGQNPLFRSGLCDHYPDLVGAWEPEDEDSVNVLGSSEYLFTDQDGEYRGVMTIGENGYRLVLQPFLLGGIIDWSGSKSRLMREYFLFMRYYLLDVSDQIVDIRPDRFDLLNAWPNPFNSTLSISMHPGIQSVNIAVLDMFGRRVGVLSVNPGVSRVLWEPRGLAAGSYYLKPEGLRNAVPLRVLYLK